MKIKEQSPFIPIEVIQELDAKARRARTAENKLVLGQTHEVARMLLNFQRERQAPKI